MKTYVTQGEGFIELNFQVKGQRRAKKNKLPFFVLFVMPAIHSIILNEVKNQKMEVHHGNRLPG
jgi:hypothetical protein